MEITKESVTEEELSRLRSLNDAHAHVRNSITNVEVTINRYKQRKQSLLTSYDETFDDIEKYESEIKEKYGDDIAINMQNGEISRKTD